jgi:hypothetical protein
MDYAEIMLFVLTTPVDEIEGWIESGAQSRRNALLTDVRFITGALNALTSDMEDVDGTVLAFNNRFTDIIGEEFTEDVEALAFIKEKYPNLIRAVEDMLRNGAGMPGPQGIQGPQGVQGEQGPSGEAGPQGNPGVQGADGKDGAGIEIAGGVEEYYQLPSNLTISDSGKAWLVNSTGLLYVWNGTSFPAEEQGVEFRGPQGIQGETGIQGPPGQRGEQGIQGPIGSTGPEGPAGVQGAVGQQGNTGATGPRGADGQQGPPGEAGPPLNLNFTGTYNPSTVYMKDDVMTYMPYGNSFICRIDNTQGASPSSEHGDETWTLFTMRGPSGATGAQGPRGADGAPGPSGTKGDSGATGSQGIQGPQGVPGPIGETGATGSPGIAGSRIISGITAPGSALGVINDWYLNIATADLYEKTAATVWTHRGNFKEMETPEKPWCKGTMNGAVSLASNTPRVITPRTTPESGFTGDRGLVNGDDFIASEDGFWELSFLGGGIPSNPSNHLRTNIVVRGDVRTALSVGAASSTGVPSVTWSGWLNAGQALYYQAVSVSTAQTTLHNGANVIHFTFRLTERLSVANEEN